MPNGQDFRLAEEVAVRCAELWHLAGECKDDIGRANDFFMRSQIGFAAIRSGSREQMGYALLEMRR